MLGRPADARQSQIESGNLCSNSEYRCFLSSTAVADYNDLHFVLDNAAACKSLVLNAFDRSSDDDTNGFVRTDVFLADLQLPCTAASLYAYMHSRRLWSLRSGPEGLHLVINHSVAMHALLLDKLPSAVATALSADLVTETGFPLDTKLHAGWQWRQLMSAGHVFKRHLLDYPKLLLLVLTFAPIVLAIYAPPSYRNALTLLRLVGNTFIHASVWRDIGPDPQLAEHFIFPHLALSFRDMSLCYLLSESTEAVFRVFRRIEQQCSFHANDRITGLLQRYLAYTAVRQAERGLRSVQPAIEYASEACEDCVSGKHGRTRIDPRIVGDVDPLFRMLDKLGFDRSKVTKQYDDGALDLLDAHSDRVPSAPVLPTLSQLAVLREQEEKQRLSDLFGDIAEAADAHMAPAPAVADSKEAKLQCMEHDAAAETSADGPAFRTRTRQRAQAKAVKSDAPSTALDSGKEEKASAKSEVASSNRAAANKYADDARPAEVPLSADDALTDYEFAQVFGSEEQQRTEEEEERKQAESDDIRDPAWKSKRRVVCSRCGQHKHKHKQAAPAASAARSGKSSLDDA